MKIRESDMPEEQQWADFFRPAEALITLGLAADCGDVVEFGCGYGTFTLPAAQLTAGTIYALDIDPQMIAITSGRAAEAQLTNVRPIQRDFLTEGTGLEDASIGYAMLFNILHAESPLALLREAHRVLVPGGILGIMHWNHDPSTPRGPSMNIRPRPEQCSSWAQSAGFEILAPGIVDLPPHHFGIAMQKCAMPA